MNENKTQVDQLTRRKSILRLTQIIGTAGIAIAAWPLIMTFGPDKRNLVSSGPMDINLENMQPGQVLKKVWRDKLVIVRYRTEDEIIAAQADNTAKLLDPEPDSQRVKVGHERWLVVFGNCPHAGCIPREVKHPDIGWVCPCHGSEFDNSGRVVKGPSTTNLMVPDYIFLSDGLTLRIGVKDA